MKTNTKKEQKPFGLACFDIDYSVSETQGYCTYHTRYKCRYCDYQGYSFYHAWKHAKKHREELKEMQMEEEG